LLVLGISFLSSRERYGERVVSCCGVWQSHSDSDYSYSQIRICHSGHLDEATQLTVVSSGALCVAVREPQSGKRLGDHPWKTSAYQK
jgi:hypothetical protein